MGKIIKRLWKYTKDTKFMLLFTVITLVTWIFTGDSNFRELTTISFTIWLLFAITALIIGDNLIKIKE